MAEQEGRSIPWIVSVDDHVDEPPHLFERWLPARFRLDDALVHKIGRGNAIRMLRLDRSTGRWRSRG